MERIRIQCALTISFCHSTYNAARKRGWPACSFNASIRRRKKSGAAGKLVLRNPLVIPLFASCENTHSRIWGPLVGGLIMYINFLERNILHKKKITDFVTDVHVPL